MSYLVNITTMKDGSVPKAIYEYSDTDNGKAAMYQTLASAIANENVATCMCLLINAVGATLAYEVYTREA